MNKEKIQAKFAALQSIPAESIAEQLNQEAPLIAADVLTHFVPEQAAQIILKLKAWRQVFQALPASFLVATLQVFPQEKAALILDYLEKSFAANMLMAFPDDSLKTLFLLISPDIQKYFLFQVLDPKQRFQFLQMLELPCQILERFSVQEIDLLFTDLSDLEKIAILQSLKNLPAVVYAYMVSFLQGLNVDDQIRFLEHFPLPKIYEYMRAELSIEESLQLVERMPFEQRLALFELLTVREKLLSLGRKSNTDKQRYLNNIALESLLEIIRVFPEKKQIVFFQLLSDERISLIFTSDLISVDQKIKWLRELPLKRQVAALEAIPYSLQEEILVQIWSSKAAAIFPYFSLELQHQWLIHFPLPRQVGLIAESVPENAVALLITLQQEEVTAILEQLDYDKLLALVPFLPVQLIQPFREKLGLNTQVDQFAEADIKEKINILKQASSEEEEKYLNALNIQGVLQLFRENPDIEDAVRWIQHFRIKKQAQVLQYLDPTLAGQIFDHLSNHADIVKVFKEDQLLTVLQKTSSETRFKLVPLNAKIGLSPEKLKQLFDVEEVKNVDIGKQVFLFTHLPFEAVEECLQAVFNQELMRALLKKGNADFLQHFLVYLAKNHSQEWLWVLQNISKLFTAGKMADIFQQIDKDTRSVLFSYLDVNFMVALMRNLPLSEAANILGFVGVTKQEEILRTLSTEVAAGVIQEMDIWKRLQILEDLPLEEAIQYLNYFEVAKILNVLDQAWGHQHYEEIVQNLNPAKLSLIFAQLSQERQDVLLNSLPLAKQGEMFQRWDPVQLKQYLQSISIWQKTKLIASLGNKGEALLGALSLPEKSKVLSRLAPEKAAEFMQTWKPMEVFAFIQKWDSARIIALLKYFDSSKQLQIVDLFGAGSSALKKSLVLSWGPREKADYIQSLSLQEAIRVLNSWDIDERLAMMEAISGEFLAALLRKWPKDFFLKQVVEKISEKKLGEAFAHCAPSFILEIIFQVFPERKALIFSYMDTEKAWLLIKKFPLSEAKQIIGAMNPEKLVEMLSILPISERKKWLEGFDFSQLAGILDALPEDHILMQEILTDRSLPKLGRILLETQPQTISHVFPKFDISNQLLLIDTLIRKPLLWVDALSQFSHSLQEELLQALIDNQKGKIIASMFNVFTGRETVNYLQSFAESLQLSLMDFMELDRLNEVLTLLELDRCIAFWQELSNERQKEVLETIQSRRAYDILQQQTESWKELLAELPSARQLEIVAFADEQIVQEFLNNWSNNDIVAVFKKMPEELQKELIGKMNWKTAWNCLQKMSEREAYVLLAYVADENRETVLKKWKGINWSKVFLVQSVDENFRIWNAFVEKDQDAHFSELKPETQMDILLQLAEEKRTLYLQRLSLMQKKQLFFVDLLHTAKLLQIIQDAERYELWSAISYAQLWDLMNQMEKPDRTVCLQFLDVESMKIIRENQSKLDKDWQKRLANEK